MVFLQIILEHKFHCLFLLDVLFYVATESFKFRTDQWTSHLPWWVALPSRVLKDGFEYPSKEPFLSLLKIYLSDAYFLIAFLVAIPTSLTNWAFFMPTGRISPVCISTFWRKKERFMATCPPRSVRSSEKQKKRGRGRLPLPQRGWERRENTLFFEFRKSNAWTMPNPLPPPPIW